MKKLWNRFLMWVGIRKVNPHNLTAQDVSLENVKQPVIAGRPTVFRSAPPERGPLEKVPSRKPNGRVSTSISSSPPSRHSHAFDDAVDAVMGVVLINEVIETFAKEPDLVIEPTVKAPESESVQVLSSSWDSRSAVDPEPGSWDGGTRFDNPTTTTFDGGGDGFFKSVGDAISGIGEAVSDATSSWSD